MTFGILGAILTVAKQQGGVMDLSVDDRQSFRAKSRDEYYYRFFGWHPELCPARPSSFQSIKLPNAKVTVFSDLILLQEASDLVEELGRTPNGYRPMNKKWDDGGGRDDYFVIATGELIQQNGLRVNRRTGEIALYRFTFNPKEVIRPDGWWYLPELDPRVRFLGKIKRSR